MSARFVLLPVFVLAILSLAVSLWAARKGQDVERKAGPIGPLELQLLFYVLIALALPLRHTDLFIVLMSWVFVVTSIVGTGLVMNPEARQRSLAWTASALVLLAMWLYFALRILLLI